MHSEEYARIFAAEQVHWWYRGLHTLTLSLLRRHVSLGDERRGRRPMVLDAGCGTGGMAAAMATIAEVTALDFSVEALIFSQRRGLPSLVRGSVQALPFRAETFDAVVSLDVLYHAAVADDRSAVREVVRVLRPGGILILNLPAYEWLRGPHDVVIETARRYTRRRVCTLLASAGLRTEWVSHWNTLLFPVAAAVRLAGRLRSHPGEGRSAIGPVPSRLNRSLSAVLAVERALLAMTRLPFGLSVVAVGRRPVRSGESAKGA